MEDEQLKTKKEENARTFSEAIKHIATHITRPRGHWTQVLLDMVSGIYMFGLLLSSERKF